MRKFRLSRLVLAATVIGVAGLFSLPAILGSLTATGAATESHSAISHVDWSNVDETYPFPSGTPTPGPSYDGDGTSDTDGGDADGDGTPDPPTDGGASPETRPIDGGSSGSGGGLLGLDLPVQAAMSVGLLALAFLALLPGRKMPADLR
ncbi:hypothetical protein [Glycomyces algeriensis]|uniref:Uncharacterized protein n=1 Tax=Glycomyces algeriensis TaxID=256037 RepID=A0A9W6G798_9ACTN|nr:hypothetical protein [Glycomyces algeriensis]MDA1366240.1 hypothetical protein [Glycomyces algeriensis]MDR7348992.1 hypothetical protein [Glycomyces algeriensis]GLI41695.1 hypothetical protein GALLR39Z86_15450 [Glycomyces algeriensis]